LILFLFPLNSLEASSLFSYSSSHYNLPPESWSFIKNDEQSEGKGKELAGKGFVFMPLCRFFHFLFVL